MSESNKKPELIFAPGCFDHFEGSQEELDQLVAEIQKMVDTGELFEKAVALDIDTLIDSLSDEEVEDLMNQLDGLDEVQSTTNRTLQ